MDFSFDVYVIPGPEKDNAGFALLASRDICDVIRYYPIRGRITVAISPEVKAVHVPGCLPWRRVEEGRPATALDDAALHKHFQEHVLADITYLKTRGYNPTRFLGIIRQHESTVAAGKYLFASSRHTSWL